MTRTLLYYEWAVYPTILLALNAIATQLAAPMQETLDKVKQVLDYCASQEEAVITYCASDMISAVHSNAGYLNEHKRSLAGGHFYLSNNEKYSPNNGAILNIVKVIDMAMSSAVEVELGALFINTWEVVYLHLILTKLGHLQPKMPIQTDNSTAEGVLNLTIQPKQTKAMDMRFEWLRSTRQKSSFNIICKWVKQTLPITSQNHLPAHHRNMRVDFLTRVSELQAMRM